MAQCLVTTLSESVSNPNIVAPDELVIKVNHVDDLDSVSGARWITFTFRSYATVRMADTSYSFQDGDGNSLGSEVSFNINVAKRLYFPNPTAGNSYKVVVSNKYALAALETQEYPSTQYDFFEFDLRDVKYCTYLASLRCMCHKITGSLADLDHIPDINYLQIGRTGISGDLANLKKNPGLRYLKASASDVYGDIAILKDLPLLRNFEVGSCLEVYGNLSAFANHTSINYVSLPQMQSHPAIEGDIANLAGCTSLSTFNATNEAKITGDISAFTNLEYLSTIYLGGTSVYGNISSLAGKTKLITVSLGNSYSETFIGPSDNKLLGNIASLSNLPQLTILALAYTGVTGDMADLINVPRLAELYLTNTAVTGEAEDFSPTAMPNLKLLDIGGCAGIAGDIADMAGHDHLQSLQIWSTNISGDIGEALEDCTTLTAVNFVRTNVSGDVTKVYKNTSILTGDVSGCINLEGDLSQLPPSFYYLVSNGRNGATFSWSANNARSSSDTIVCFDNVNFGADLEKMLINQASCQPRGVVGSWLHRHMYVYGSNTSATSMSADCRTACDTLIEKGFTIYINDVLVPASNA